MQVLACNIELETQDERETTSVESTSGDARCLDFWCIIPIQQAKKRLPIACSASRISQAERLPLTSLSALMDTFYKSYMEIESNIHYIIELVQKIRKL